MRTCPVCGNQAADEAKTCDCCGFRLSGGTESFTVVDQHPSEGTRKDVSYGFPILEVAKGPMKGEVFKLTSFPVSIGRDPACDLFLNNRTVSRLHACIEEEKGDYFIQDEASMNGTWLNGKVVGRSDLQDGDHLQIGTFHLVFRKND